MCPFKFGATGYEKKVRCRDSVIWMKMGAVGAVCLRDTVRKNQTGAKVMVSKHMVSNNLRKKQPKISMAKIYYF